MFHRMLYLFYMYFKRFLWFFQVLVDGVTEPPAGQKIFKLDAVWGISYIISVSSIKNYRVVLHKHMELVSPAPAGTYFWWSDYFFIDYYAFYVLLPYRINSFKNY